MATRFPTERVLHGVLALLAFGCQAADEDDDAARLAQTSASLDAGVIDATADRDAADGARPPSRDAGTPARAFIAEVTANGTGCPAGTWNTAISPDGQLFTTTFSKYDTDVADGQKVDFEDCNLTVQVRAPREVAYAVDQFFAQGYAFLERGVQGFFSANYYFQGNPVPSSDREKRHDLAGPLDRSFLIQDIPRDADTVWSPCGLDRNLQIVTRVGLQKSQSQGSGYIDMTAVDGTIGGKVIVRIKTRPCTAASQP